MQHLSWDRASKEAEQEVNDLSRSDIEHLIDEWVLGMHAERNRAIAKRHMLDGICYEPLAEEFDLSVRQVKTIVKRAILAISKHIQ